VLIHPGVQDRDVTLVVIGAACERISCRVVFDELDRLDSLIPDHDVDVVDKEETARKPFIDVGADDRDRNLANDVALGPPSAHQCAETLDLRAGGLSAVGRLT
jgi:hypothetical protein